jgi:predicted aconitase with swiveling domain
MELIVVDIIIKGRKIVGGKVHGQALVSRQDICFVSVDPEVGVITERNHELEGISIVGKILIYPTGKGSTGGSYALYGLVKRNVAPKGIINLKADPITAIGAIIGNVPMIDKIDSVDPKKLISTGDYVELDADQGIALVTRNNS